MEILFIDACVRQTSRTRILCEKYVSQKYSENDLIKRIVLAKTEMFSLTEERLSKRESDIANHDYTSQEYQYAKQFAQADEIVIGAPYWDSSFPSIMKVFIENICVNGLTFGFDADGTPKKLCKAQKLVYITTAGGYLKKNNSLKIQIKELCQMFGITEVLFYSAEGLDIVGNNAESILESAALFKKTDVL